MLFIYNILQLLLAPLACLLLPVYLISRPEKSKTILPKLGIKLKPVEKHGRTVVWIHALSVGEVTSAAPLVRRLKQNLGDQVVIVFTASTVTGLQLAENTLAPFCDRRMYAPLDILPVVNRCIRIISADLFIQVETDFWPNLLHGLNKSRTPMILVNGRISASSISRYRRFSFFFGPLFDQFDRLCMQTEADQDKMLALGIDPHKISVLGNLKFADIEDVNVASADSSPFPEDRLIFLCGSTHAGEESVLLEAFADLHREFKNIHLVLAPRKIERIDNIIPLIEDSGFTFRRLTEQPQDTDVTLVDTIGDLSGLYRFGDICFIGGSLVDQGGHNPLEAARFGKVALFGPYMDDFSEISSGLVQAGGALQVSGAGELRQVVASLFISEEQRLERGRRGLNFISDHQHVLDEHMNIIKSLL